MKHEGTLLNDVLAKGRKSGHVEISESEVNFLSDEEELLSLPIEDIIITQGGAGNRYVYFSHPDFPNFTIATDDKKVLNYPAFKKDNSQLKAILKIKSNRKVLWFSFAAMFALIVGLFLSFFIFRGAIVEKVAHQIPVTWEQNISTSMLEGALAGKKIVSDSVILDQLDAITDPIVNAVENKDFKFNFTIVEDETLNAYALPGGSIVIHSGLIERATDVNEVAGVLAHEISHVTRRHHIRGLVDKIGFFMLLRAFLGDASGIGAELAFAGASLESLKYSRDYELEADESGWELMLKANVDPKGMIAFFEKLQHEHGDMPEEASFLSTHPATEERIKKLKNRALKATSYTPINIDFEQFKKDIDVYFTVN